MKKYYIILSVLFSILWFGCEKDEEKQNGNNHENITLLKVEERLSYPSSLVETILAAAENSLGEGIQLTGRNPDPVKVYYVEYESTYINNEKITLSGLVCAPVNADKKCTLLSFQNGTMSLHSSAPSNQLTHPEFSILHALAGLGYVVVIADYPGFGSSENIQHPYYHKALFQQCIRDLVIAAQDMALSEKYNFTINNKLYLTGYSLGGWATLVAHNSIENNPIEGIELLGSACGAGAYDLIAMREHLVQQTHYTQPFYVPNLLMGFKSVNDISYDLSVYINEPYASQIPNLIDGEHSSEEVNSALTHDMTALFTDGFLNNFYSETEHEWIELRNVLTNNSQYAWTNLKPITLYHGNNDNHVPYFLSEDLLNEFRSIGVEEDMVKLITLTDEDHISGLLPMYKLFINEILQN